MTKTILKYATAAIFAGALALTAATPTEARDGRNTAAAIGFRAGALVGAAAAGANNSYYYGPTYGYYDDPAYTYEPAYPVYSTPYRYRYNNYAPSCAIDMGYGRLDYSTC